MKRVICLYHVSTLGQVDHDDIPMQRIACREYTAGHPDWEIVDEISEKGVSGYKVATEDRDAITELKKRAIRHQFDVLLVLCWVFTCRKTLILLGFHASRFIRRVFTGVFIGVHGSWVFIVVGVN